MKIKTNYLDDNCIYTLSQNLKEYLAIDYIILCIGTDKCIGDALGPLVGSYLMQNNFPLKVFGTIEEPVHAINLPKYLNIIKENYPNFKIVAIDACLTDNSETIGEIYFRTYSVHPGKGVGKTLPDVGDISILGVVDSDENFLSNSIRLNFIFKMAKVIGDSLILAVNELANTSFKNTKTEIIENLDDCMNRKLNLSSESFQNSSESVKNYKAFLNFFDSHEKTQIKKQVNPSTHIIKYSNTNSILTDNKSLNEEISLPFIKNT